MSLQTNLDRLGRSLSHVTLVVSTVLCGFLWIQIVHGIDSEIEIALDWHAGAMPIAAPWLVEPGKVTVVVFTDYQCPACAQAVPAVRTLLERMRTAHPSSLVVSVRDFPLDPECNPHIDRLLHPMACEAAVAMHVVRRKSPDRSAGFEGWLYQYGERLSEALLTEQLSAAGALSEFEAAYNEVLQAVEADVSLGESIGVIGTPTIFVNGVKIAAHTIAILEKILEFELSGRSQQIRGQH